MGPVRHARTILGGGILLFQLVMIGYARYVPARYFCWAEIRSRYRRPHGVDNRSIQHVMDIVQQYEESYGRGDRPKY